MSAPPGADRLGDGRVPVHPGRAWLRGAAEVEGVAGKQPAGAQRRQPSGKGLCPPPMAALCPSPSPADRVVQVCVGAQHGILLTVAGAVFTWGDNRYGQLGRPATEREEDQGAFPVVGMLGCEVTQVAAGAHHCLALAAPGVVFAWGRNKAGQLGCGSFRDRVAPVPVLGADDEQLGSAGEPERIVTIGAGLSSSIAAALNSDVWQWGQVSAGFCQGHGHPQGRSKGSAGAGVREAGAHMNRPFRVFRKPQYRSGLRSRQDRVSIGRTACRVVPPQVRSLGSSGWPRQDEARIKSLVDAVQELQGVVARERETLASSAAQRRLQPGAAQEPSGVDDGSLEAIGDNIALLERDLLQVAEDLSRLEQSLQGCSQVQAENRKQIQVQTQRGLSLCDSQDQISLRLIGLPKSGGERRRLEERLEDIRDILEASKNAKTTLLDRCAESDVEKHHLAHDIKDKREESERIRKRLKALRALNSAVEGSPSLVDPLVRFLKEQMTTFASRFCGRPAESDFAELMRQLRDDQVYLDDVEGSIKDAAAAAAAASSETKRQERSRQTLRILEDLVDLQRSWTGMLRDERTGEDLEISGLFESSSKVEATPRAVGLEVRGDPEDGSGA